jgi:GntR family transcriptional repressor for pyruvate dehydrogenase complex
MEPATRQVTFEAFEKDILPNKIVSSLLTLIKDKELLPGDKLPPERELAELMNVSRSALREALRALAVMNVVEIRPGSGTFVTTLSPEQLVAPLAFMFALDDATIFQLFEARETLELRTVALAARHIAEEEIIPLETCLEEMATFSDNPDIREELDQEFHRLVARASRNPILARFVAAVNSMGTECRRQTHAWSAAAAQSLEDHRAILDALKTRDPEAAQQAMSQHLQHAEGNLRRLMCK